MNSRESINLAIVYKKIAGMIYKESIDGNVFNRYEYYKMGGLPLRKALDVIHELRKKRLLRNNEYSILNSYIENQLIFGPSRNKEFILSTYYQFGEYAISDVEKQMIWDNLNLLGLEDKYIDDLVFSGAVREYAYQKGLLKVKKSLSKKKKNK